VVNRLCRNTPDLTTPALLILMALMISACSKTQNEAELPVLDAIGGDFTLPSTLTLENGLPGAPLTLSNYQGQVVLINFGYTHCPDICPTVLSRLAKLSKALDEQRHLSLDNLKIIFITVDPERDTLAHLKEYLAFFSPDFIGARGTIGQTQQVAQQYAVFFEKQAEDGQNYSVMHNDKIFLLDKLGRLRALYGHSDSDEKLINDIVSLAY